MINFYNALTFADIDNKFSNFFLEVINRIASGFNNLLGLLPDDPGFLSEIDVSKIVEYLEIIHYFVPLHFISVCLGLSVYLFLTIEIGMLIYSIILKIAAKVADSWALFFA